MRISIITPAYNNADSIERTLDSLLGQTYTDFEHIVIDNCSTDGTLDHVRNAAYPEGSSCVIVSEPDSGIYNAINKGLMHATGDIVGILHANDALSSPTILASVAETFADEQCRMIYGDISWRSHKNPNKVVRYFDASTFTIDMLRYGIAPPHPSLYLRRDVAIAIGPYKEDYAVAADFDMFIRLMITHNTECRYLPIEMVAMSTGGSSGKFYNRIVTNTVEKRRALRENNISAHGLIFHRYLYNIKQLFFKKARHQ
jgi:glycosyltransferase